jgi:hypothetical protein
MLSRVHHHHAFFLKVIRIMRRFTCILSAAVLSFLFLGLVGCSEDNEQATKETAKGGVIVDPAKAIPQAGSMEEYAKSNPGMHGAATGSGKVTPKK